MSILMDKYLSPDDEASIFKGIPMAMRESIDVRNIMMTGKFTVKYRGGSTPTYKRSPYNTVREHATSFAIYAKSPRRISRRDLEGGYGVEQLIRQGR